MVISRRFEMIDMGTDNRIELDEKYVFHIPLYRHVDGKLVLIEIDEILNDLINMFHQNGFDSLYMAKIKSYYKARLYDEILLTIFSSAKSPVAIFEEWFRINNDLLGQEAFAYEIGDRMIIFEFE